MRRNLPTILEQYRGAGVPDELLIISGEAIYQMVRPMLPACWLRLSSLRHCCCAGDPVPSLPHTATSHAWERRVIAAPGRCLMHRMVHACSQGS